VCIFRCCPRASECEREKSNEKETTRGNGREKEKRRKNACESESESTNVCMRVRVQERDDVRLGRFCIPQVPIGSVYCRCVYTNGSKKHAIQVLYTAGAYIHIHKHRCVYTYTQTPHLWQGVVVYTGGDRECERGRDSQRGRERARDSESWRKRDRKHA